MSAGPLDQALVGPFALLLNLDAELELADPIAFRRSAAMAEQIRRRGRELAAPIDGVFPGTEVVLLPAAGRSPIPRGIAWCPTPSAVAELERRGARLVDGYTQDLVVLQRANHRGFVVDAGLGRPLPSAVFARGAESAFGALEATPAVGTGAWLAKRAFGFAGRWRKRIVPGALTRADRVWVESSFTGEYGVGVADRARGGALARFGGARFRHRAPARRRLGACRAV